MLAGCIAAPIAMGLAFRFLIPMGEQLLCAHFNQTAILAPYYRLADLLLAVMTPVMAAFAGVMVILSELDNGTARYLVITPVGKIDYLCSRLGIPAAVAAVYDMLLIYLFGLTEPTGGVIALYAIFGAVYSVMTAMLVVAFAKNRVEGMALTKMSGLMLVGLFIPFFVQGKVQYAAAFLPCFWISKFSLTGGLGYGAAALLTALGWIAALERRFKQRLL